MYYPFNATAISLIPMVENAVNMKNFSPISWCNLLYKCISTILIDRLKKVIPDLINPNQNAFTKGRNIAENILMMHE